MQTLATFEQLVNAASTRNINLNDQVDRDNAFRPLHGGSAIVYLGTLHSQRQKVAIKSIRLSPTGHKTAIQHITEVIQVWSKLRHENIVSVFGIVTKFDFAVSVVYKWIPTGNAYDYVQNTETDPRPPLLGIARGLHYLHGQVSAPILHGDLRGKNVMVGEDGHALLSDYGLTSLIESSFDMTAATPIHPTVRWMAPEQIDNNGKVTTQGDVWALGMTALELFTRQPPYSAIHDMRGIITRILQEPPDRPSDESTCSRMTDQWWEICTLCWTRDESLRPSISAILKGISAVV
ncbi:hypothetical protein ID866_5142 [Astraeus odoratus]|nr:hypothetical protein ID866_5142 [Astraeus odoratus]